MELVDTDVLIDIQRGHPPAVAWFASLNELPDVPGYVVMELIQSARNAAEIQRVVQFIAPLKVVWPTEVDCEQALKNYTALHLSHGLGLLDALTTSIAVGSSATLLTFNQKHFAAVPQLRIAKPYVR